MLSQTFTNVIWSCILRSVFASLAGRKYIVVMSIRISLIMSKIEYVLLCLTASIHTYFFFYELSRHIIFPLNYCIAVLFLSVYRNSLYIQAILPMMSMQMFFLFFSFFVHIVKCMAYGIFFFLIVKSFPLQDLFLILLFSSSVESHFLCLNLGSIQNLFYCKLWKSYQHYFFQMVTQLSLHYLWDNSLCSVIIILKFIIVLVF